MKNPRHGGTDEPPCPVRYSGGGADCPNPFTARTIQADFQFTSPGDMVSAHSFVVLGSPEEIERSIRAIVTFARSANSPFVTSSR